MKNHYPVKFHSAKLDATNLSHFSSQQNKSIMNQDVYTRFRTAISRFALALLTVLLTVGLGSVTSELKAQIYVDADAVGNNDGTTWADAYTDLAVAIDMNCPGGGELWVAEGTYYPTTGTVRAESFDLCDNLELYGGFDGTETMRSERDFVTNITILSGDIQQNGSAYDRSYNVITAISAGGNAVLDGFTISDGAANGTSGVNSEGGGLHVGNFALTIGSCVFDGNIGKRGGAIYFENSVNSVIQDTEIKNGSASVRGGAIYFTSTSTVEISNSMIDGLSAGDGGGLWIENSSDVTLTNSTISNCEATGTGGGIYAFNSTLDINTNSEINTNSAIFYGGGVYVIGGQFSISQTSFS